MKAHCSDNERLFGEEICLLIVGKAIEACDWLCKSELNPMEQFP
jgi:hypothetical protein